MHNAIPNALKGYSAATDKRRVTLCALSSKQVWLRQALLEFVVRPHKAAGELKVELLSLRPREPLLEDWAASAAVGTTEFASHSPQKALEELKQRMQNTKASVVVVLGLEVLGLGGMGEQLAEFVGQWKNWSLGPKAKFIHLVVFEDQIESAKVRKSLRSSAKLVIDFSEAAAAEKFAVWGFQLSDTAPHTFEKIEGHIKDGLLGFGKWPDEERLAKVTNPDKTIGGSFKLALTDREREEKNRVVLPYAKREAEEQSPGPVEEEEELPMDEEMDPEDDYDV